MTFCRCCFITALPPAVSHTERPVLLCDECGPHYGNADKTAVAHDAMMLAYREANARALERLDERRLAAITDLTDARARVDELTATVASGYSAKLGNAQSLVEQAVVADSAAKERAARTARDRAMAVLVRLTTLHHETGDTCSCGKRITQCPEFAVLAPFLDELRRWESRQARGATAG
jgi:hypothetical protein